MAGETLENFLSKTEVGIGYERYLKRQNTPNPLSGYGNTAPNNRTDAGLGVREVNNSNVPPPIRYSLPAGVRVPTPASNSGRGQKRKKKNAPEVAAVKQPARQKKNKTIITDKSGENLILTACNALKSYVRLHYKSKGKETPSFQDLVKEYNERPNTSYIFAITSIKTIDEAEKTASSLSWKKKKASRR